LPLGERTASMMKASLSIDGASFVRDF
jgi:hypothetical protein